MHAVRSTRRLLQECRKRPRRSCLPPPPLPPPAVSACRLPPAACCRVLCGCERIPKTVLPRARRCLPASTLQPSSRLHRRWAAPAPVRASAPRSAEQLTAAAERLSTVRCRELLAACTVELLKASLVGSAGCAAGDGGGAGGAAGGAEAATPEALLEALHESLSAQLQVLAAAGRGKFACV